jgi:predicted membrane protein (TIGR00267 family)
MAVVMVAAVDGFSPFLSALLVVLPFFVAGWLPEAVYAYYASIAMALVALFALGIYLGRLSRQNLFFSGIKTGIAGIVCMALSYLLEQLAR